MKKLFYLLSLALCLTLLLCMTGCGESEPKTASELWNKIGSEMSLLSSFRADTEVKMEFYTSGQKIESNIEGYTVYILGDDNDLYYCSVADGKVKAASANITETMSSMELYEDGQFFIKNIGSDSEQKIWSDMTKEEFLDLQRKRTKHSFDYTDCANSSFAKSEDGSFVITCSGYSQDSVNKQLEVLSITNNTIAENIIDLEITLSADSSYRLQAIDMKLVPGVGNGQAKRPQIQITTTYSDYNCAEEDTPFIAKKGFSKMDNIAFLFEVDDMFKALENASEGSFVYDITQTVTVDGRQSVQKEKDVVSYVEKDGKYYYNVEATVGASTKIDINYEDGYQSVTSSGNTQRTEQTKAEAKEYIKSLINNVRFNTRYVCDIVEIGEGEYEIKLNSADATPYKQVFSSMGAKYGSIKQTILITVREGKIVTTKNFLTAKGTYVQGNVYSISISVNSTTTFEEPEL